MSEEELQSYLDEITIWQQTMDKNLRKADGWLSLVGLDWVDEGINTIGSAEDNQIVLPADAPAKLGVIDFSKDEIKLLIETDAAVTIDDLPTKSAVLRDDHNQNGPSLVKIGSISFSVIKRGSHYGIRVRDSQSPAIANFNGRNWYPIDSSYKVLARFFPHENPRSLEIVNSVGMIVPMQNPGYVEFELHQQQLRLEAFEADETQWWFIFKDGTSGLGTYPAGRFLYGQRLANGQVSVDFNRAYNPPCAFTVHATCPLAPRENTLNIQIQAGERYSG